MSNRKNPVAKKLRTPEFRMRVVGAVKGRGAYKRRERYKLTVRNANDLS